eukprot:TRINITY_DN39812_c0_g1_i1.p3 TRINITY_DN39812_c0_g1~~TRINITY_DN39812_c0_g1_i1.p3  ORF type:complete len:148 (+),score=17.81 TRINITY_DN39812_c0_g1_i1:87-530(+)
MLILFLNDTATTEIYTRSIVGSVRCVQETVSMLTILIMFFLTINLSFHLVHQHNIYIFLPLHYLNLTQKFLAYMDQIQKNILLFLLRNHQVHFFLSQVINFSYQYHFPFLSPMYSALILSLIHISEPTRPLYISYAVFCLKKKKRLN